MRRNAHGPGLKEPARSVAVRTASHTIGVAPSLASVECAEWGFRKSKMTCGACLLLLSPFSRVRLAFRPCCIFNVVYRLRAGSFLYNTPRLGVYAEFRCVLCFRERFLPLLRCGRLCVYTDRCTWHYGEPLVVLTVRGVDVFFILFSFARDIRLRLVNACTRPLGTVL